LKLGVERPLDFAHKKRPEDGLKTVGLIIRLVKIRNSVLRERSKAVVKSWSLLEELGQRLKSENLLKCVSLGLLMVSLRFLSHLRN